jgi:hypothetical protein
MASRWQGLVVSVLVVSLFGCGDDAAGPGADQDAGSDAGGNQGGTGGSGGTGGTGGGGGTGGSGASGGTGGSDEDAGGGCSEGQQDNDDGGTCEADCTDVDCGEHGSCDDASGEAVCVCDLAYEGDACDQLGDPPAAGLALWLDAANEDTLTMSGDTVVRWINAADGNTFFEQPTALERPTLVADALNGKPAVRFAGAQYMSFADFTGLKGVASYRVFVVMTDQNDTESGAVLAGVNGEDATAGVGDHGLLIATNATASGLRLLHRMPWGATGGLDLTTPAVLDLATPSVLRFSVDAPGASSHVAVHVNGSESATKNGTVDAFDRNLDLTLGRLSPSQALRFLEGDVAEVLLYTGSLDADTTALIEAYLTARWDIAP